MHNIQAKDTFRLSHNSKHSESVSGENTPTNHNPNVTADFRQMNSNISANDFRQMNSNKSDHFTPTRLFEFNSGQKKNDGTNLDGYYATLLSEGSRSRSSVSQQDAPRFVQLNDDQ